MVLRPFDTCSSLTVSLDSSFNLSGIWSTFLSSLDCIFDLWNSLLLSNYLFAEWNYLSVRNSQKVSFLITKSSKIGQLTATNQVLFIWGFTASRLFYFYLPFQYCYFPGSTRLISFSHLPKPLWWNKQIFYESDSRKDVCNKVIRWMSWKIQQKETKTYIE